MIVKTVEVPPRPPTPDESFGDTMFVIDLMRQEKEKKDRLLKVQILPILNNLTYLLHQDKQIQMMAMMQKKKKEEDKQSKWL